MPSLFPEVEAGGVVIRDAGGVATNPPGVERAYVPAAPFDSSCLLTALPSDCEARIEPRQLNAIVSELVSFAECLDPNGSWNCSSLQNLCTAFTQWMAFNLSQIYVGVSPPPSPPPNQLWWESDSGNLFVWYNDGSSTQWVQINAGTMVEVDGVSIVGAGTATNPFSVSTIDCGSY